MFFVFFKSSQPCHILLNGLVNRRTDDQSYPLIIQDWSLCSSHLPETQTAFSLPLCVYCLSMFSFPLFIPSPSLLFYFSSSPLLPPTLRKNYRTLSLAPPAGVWSVKSGGCWGSSQSCKWGSPPGWPRHTVVQVRKPATLLTNSSGRE